MRHAFALLAGVLLSGPAMAQMPGPYQTQPGPYQTQPGPYQGQPGPYGIPLGPSQNPDTRALEQEAAAVSQQAAAMAMQRLARNAIVEGNKLYVGFRVNNNQPPGPPQNPFAPQVPFNAAPVVREGIMEITLEGPPRGSAHCWRADLAGCPPFVVDVTARVQAYRLFVPGSGWQQFQQMQMPHIWSWQGRGGNGSLELESTTDHERGTNDDGLTDFVASVFNVPVSSVQTGRPNGIPGGGPAPAQRSCGPHVNPDGTISGRPCYN